MYIPFGGLPAILAETTEWAVKAREVAATSHVALGYGVNPSPNVVADNIAAAIRAITAAVVSVRSGHPVTEIDQHLTEAAAALEVADRWAGQNRYLAAAIERVTEARKVWSILL